MAPLVTTLERPIGADRDPQMALTQNHRGVHLNCFAAQPEHPRHQFLKPQQTEHRNAFTNVTYLKPNNIEDGDPLNSPRRLESGATLLDMESDLPNTIKKSPSNQELAKPKWGTSNRRTNGRSKTGLQIRVPDRQSPRPIPPGPLLYDKSIVYIYSSSSSGGGRTTHSFGAIGDHRSPNSGPSSAPLTYKTPERLRTRGLATAGGLSHLVLHNLVVESTLDSNRYKSLVASESVGPRTAPLNCNAPGSPPIEGLATAVHLQHPTLHDLVDDSIPDSDQYDLSVAGETGPLRQAIAPYRIAPSRLRVRTRRRRSMIDLKETPVTSPRHVKAAAVASTSHEDRTPFPDAQATESHLQVDGIFEEPEVTSAPTWRRNGPSFASLIRPMASLNRGPHIAIGSPRPAIEDTTRNEDFTFQDQLDPEEFSLPFGSIVFSMKSNNVTNLQISVTKSIWTSTLGSNIVLTEAWQRKKSEEKIILLFSITHSTKHSGKYLGMAEMVGPLDLDADCTFWTEKKSGTRGTIPIRWIVTKDVPFPKFHDLKYHEQHVTQVRHGNTIPGEVGRLVIQRYFEAAHGSTAILYPLSQAAHDIGAAQSLSRGQARGWSGPSNRHEAPTDPFQRGRGGFRAGFRAGFRGSLQARWFQNGPQTPLNAAYEVSSSASGELSQPVPGSFHSTFWRFDTPTNGQHAVQGGLGSALPGLSPAVPGGFHGTVPPNNYLFLPRGSHLQQQRGPRQQSGRYPNQRFNGGRNSRFR